MILHPKQAPNYFDRLPDELVDAILQLVGSRTASQYLSWPSIALVCRRFRNIVFCRLFQRVGAPSAYCQRRLFSLVGISASLLRHVRRLELQGDPLGNFQHRPHAQEAAQLLEELVALEELSVHYMWNVVAALLYPPNDDLLPNLRVLSIDVPLNHPLDPTHFRWLTHHRNLRILSIHVLDAPDTWPPAPPPSFVETESTLGRNADSDAAHSRPARRHPLFLRIDARDLHGSRAAGLVNASSCTHLALREAAYDDADSLLRTLLDLEHPETLLSLALDSPAWSEPYTDLSSVLTSFTSLQSLTIVRGIDLDTLVEAFSRWPQHPPIVELPYTQPAPEPQHILGLMRRTKRFGRLKQIRTERLPFGDAELEAIRALAQCAESSFRGSGRRIVVDD
ncbi:hypothetical protein JCM10021v2_006631 [Rhodotorula toruloides]